jgi:hypothetical protein
MKGGLWARRFSAEQENPGSPTLNPNWWKGVTAMVKHVFNKIESIHPVALAIVGWLTFVFGQVVQPICLKLMLLSAARVLPRVLRS